MAGPRENPLLQVPWTSLTHRPQTFGAGLGSETGTHRGPVSPAPSGLGLVGWWPILTHDALVVALVPKDMLVVGSKSFPAVLNDSAPCGPLVGTR